MIDIAKNNVRILVVENWPFQLMDTLSELGQVGYFNTYPALSSQEALTTLTAPHAPYDTALLSTSMEASELTDLILKLSKGNLTRHFALIGNTQPTPQCLKTICAVNRADFSFLGILEKPLSATKLAKVLMIACLNKLERT
ncbi:hypothetical protein CER19_05140 [Pseudomonas sp. GL93]|uniref:hypothetical protein n=1 Tax=Pseudomonas sp. GL93 TaxID=2014741 RepID=UPI000E315E2F|nr:hypothetical protein [Pseudomonas sp. GL93]RFD32547.1 hypothetical protein CER19_05140 [Pseudomonas sp. GL93]